MRKVVHQRTRRIVAWALLLASWTGAGELTAQSLRLDEACQERVEEAQKRLGIRIVWQADQIPRCTWPLEFAAASESDRKLLQQYLHLLAEELMKYPRAFVKASRLRVVAVGKGLVFRKQPRSALPDYVQETLYYDFSYLGRSSKEYVRHVIHHEYFHMLEEEWNGSAYFKDPSWAKLNEPGFRYGSGGVNARDSSVSTFNHPRAGFVNGYAMSGLEEDKAEVWASMFVPGEWKLVAAWCEEDERLRQKVTFLEQAARRKCRQMDPAYWERVRR